MHSVLKNTRLAWLTQDLTEDYAVDDGVNEPVKKEGAETDSSSITKSDQNVAWVLGVNSFFFPLNAATTYAVGMWGLFLEKPTFEELSTEVYPTMLSPEKWAFYVWHAIFATQFFWVLLPLLFSGKRDSAYLHKVDRSYMTLTLAQMGYTLSYVNEIMWLSFVFLLGVLASLLIIFQRIYSVEKKTPSIGTYVQWFLPFSIHLGWVLPTSVYQLTVVLQTMGLRDDIDAILTEIVLTFAVFFMALLFCSLKDFVVPGVIAGYFASVYYSLEDPAQEIRETYTAEQISIVQYGSAGAAGIIAFWGFIQLLSAIIDIILDKEGTPAPKKESDDKAFDSASAYVEAPEKV